MPLSTRQTKFYWDTCDIWSISDPDPASNALPSVPTYTLNAAGVACRFVPKSSVDTLQTVGQVEGDDLLTTDEIRLPEGQAVESSWVIVNKTLLSDGSQGPYYGKAWIARGEARRRISTPGRPVGRTIVYASKLPDNAIPAGVS